MVGDRSGRLVQRVVVDSATKRPRSGRPCAPRPLRPSTANPIVRRRNRSSALAHYLAGRAFVSSPHRPTSPRPAGLDSRLFRGRVSRPRWTTPLNRSHPLVTTSARGASFDGGRRRSIKSRLTTGRRGDIWRGERRIGARPRSHQQHKEDDATQCPNRPTQIRSVGGGILAKGETSTSRGHQQHAILVSTARS